MIETPPTPSAPHRSPDGLWDWNGTAWVSLAAPPPPPPVYAPKKSHLIRNIVLGVVALIVIGTCGSAMAAAGSKSGNSSAASSPAAAPVAQVATVPSPSPKAVPTPSPKAVPAPIPVKTAGPLFDLTGSGTSSTAAFAVHGNWDLAWWYDCTGTYGGTGNFIAEVYTADNSISFDNQGINQLGAIGNGVEHYHSDQGSPYYLKVISECSWHLIVTGI